MKSSSIYRPLALGLLLSFATSCSFFEVEDMVDPNSPSVEAFVKNATRTQIDQLSTGVFAAMRGGFSDYFRITGSLGREVYVLNTTESRWYTDLLGETTVLDNNSFLNDYYSAFAATRRRALVLEQSAEASTSLSAIEKEGIKGFANTIKAFAMLYTLNMQGDNGIRADVEDVLNPGPIVSKQQSLAAIRQLLDEANTQLSNGGDNFAFTVPAGFADFDTPQLFARFNRALAARVALYQEDFNGLLTILPQTFMDLTGSLTAGPAFTYGNEPDVNNPLFQTVNSTQAALVVVHPSIVTAFAANDKRRGKIRERNAPRQLGVLTGTHEPALYATNVTPIPIIRNEELILIYAEAQAKASNGNTGEAVKAINIIRNAAEIGAYAGGQSAAELQNEIFEQRKLSLWYEGHRWIDARRLGRLDQLPLDAANHKVFDRMPVPFAEIQWDQANGN